MTEQAILEALQKAVTAAVTALADSSLPPTDAAIKYVGRNFVIPSESPWLEIVYIPNNITDECWGTEKTFQGLLRLILHWPMTDRGAYAPLNMIEGIGAYFKKGSRFADDPMNPTVFVKINDNPNLLGVLEEPPEMLLPLSIRYQFFKAP